jgi:hypothetical protein
VPCYSLTSTHHATARMGAWGEKGRRMRERGSIIVRGKEFGQRRGLWFQKSIPIFAHNAEGKRAMMSQVATAGERKSGG